MPTWGTCAFLKSPLLTQSVSGQMSCWPGLTALTPTCLLAPLPGKVAGPACACLLLLTHAQHPLQLLHCPPPPPALGSVPLSWKNRVLSKPTGSQRGVAQPCHFLPGRRGPSAAWDWLLRGAGVSGECEVGRGCPDPPSSDQIRPSDQIHKQGSRTGRATWSCTGRDCRPGWGL